MTNTDKKNPTDCSMCTHLGISVFLSNFIFFTEAYMFLLYVTLGNYNWIMGMDTHNHTVVASIVWAFRGLKKPRSREMSARSDALHSVCPQLFFFTYLSWVLQPTHDKYGPWQPLISPSTPTPLSSPITRLPVPAGVSCYDDVRVCGLKQSGWT